MKPASTCLITGAYLYDKDNQRHLHGDLYQIHDTLVFNGGNCEWQSLVEHPFQDHWRVVKPQLYHESRNVFVFPIGVCQFNSTARDFLQEMLAHEALYNRGHKQ